ncbi:DUF1573 domain-containing protein [Chitinophagaceae bacterium MMS25-I14]
MKKIIPALLFSALSSGAFAQSELKPQSSPAVIATVVTPAKTNPKPDDKKGPRFRFKEETYDFKDLKEGPVAEHVFEFKNIGKEPLIIQSASASCGCTKPEWPTEPILPGKSGKITVRYTTEKHVGPFMKDVYIVSNAVSDKPRYELHIKGTVAAKTADTK